MRFKGTDREEAFDIAIDGFFLGIGHRPNTDIFASQIALDEQGYIKTDGVTTATNIPGVFAAGDVADPRYRQAITSAGMGCKAALDAERFLVRTSESTACNSRTVFIYSFCLAVRFSGVSSVR